MGYAAHFVVVPGTRIPRASEAEDLKTCLTRQFPQSLVDSFRVLTDPSNSQLLLFQEPNALLQQLSESRASSGNLPIIFLAYELGGIIVKRALVLAQVDARYQDIAFRTQKVVFFGTVHRATRAGWGPLYRYLDPAADHSPNLGLRELEEITADFLQTFSSFDVTSVYGYTEPSTIIDGECFTLGRCNETTISQELRHENLWRFTGKVAKMVCQQILGTKNSKYHLLGDFFRRLWFQDPQTHQIEPNPHHETILDWICITGQIKAWKTDPTAQILHFTDQSGGTATDIAASILGSLLNQTYDRDVVCLSFQFDGNNILTLNNFAFYSSLCRQLLSCRPRLFEHVYFAANLLVKNENCTAKALQAILRCMLANLIDTEKVSVYCVINAVGECVAPPADVTEFMSELVKLGYGRFKLILSGKTSPMSALKSTNDWHFDLKPNSVSGVAFKKRYVQETVRTLTTDISAGNELKHLVTRHLELLWDDSFFLTAKLNMMLTLRQSKQNTRQMLETKPCPLPTTPENFYKYIISVMDGDCYMAKRALFWIANVVRPLSSTELAVAVAFEKASWNDESLDRIEDLISENSVDDLTWHTKILITRKNNRIYLIHDTLREFMHEPSTHKAWQTEDFRLGRGNHSEGRKIIRSDTHFEILFQCLEHLKNFGEQALESMRRTRGARHSLPTAEKYSFLRYACFHWPQHCQKARPVKEAQYYVSTFLEDDKMVGVWSKLYLLLSPPTKNRIEVLDDRFKIACKFGLLDLFKHFMDKLKPEEARLRMREPLNIAARNGHDTIVKMLIEHDINSPEAVGLAAAGGFQNIVEQLLSEGSDIDAPDKTGYTPLHHATYGGHIGLVDLLLASGADPNVLTSPPPSYASVSLETTEKKYTQGERQYDFLSGSSFELDTFGMELHPSRPETSNPFLHPPGKETSLHLAALTGQVEIARLLLDFGADVNANDSGYDPLKYAAEGGFPEMLTLLLDRKADPDTAAKLDGNTALHLASTRGHVKAVEILLRHSHNSFKLTRTVNGKGLSPMHIVARDGNLKLWNLMGLVKKNESDYQSTLPLQSSGRGISKSALEWAAENGHFEIVEELLKKNYWERQPRNETGAVVLAASHGHTRIITVLLNNYLSHPESESRMAIALHLAARGGHLKTLELLLGHPRGLRSQINVQEANKLTPLHIAVHQGHSNVIYLLLKSGADMDIQDKRGRTPLHIAADNGYLQCVQMLLGLGRRGDWRIRDPLERRAMYCAERFGHLPIVERVCSRSMAILWDEDKDHLTAFDLVVGRNSIQKVEAFVQILHDTEDHGSEFERRGTPLHVACQKQNMELFHFIREKGWSCKKRDSDGRTVLHRAVLHDFTQGVEFLLENEPNHVFAKDESNRTVLHYARTPQMARNLLEAGAEIDPMDSEGHTPLFMAASRGDVGVVGFLLNSTPKPDVHAQDCLGQNMLHAGFEHLPVLELMLEHKVNPNVFASNGTPLALTTDSNFLDNAKLLIEAGAQPNMWTRFENSPLYLACQSAENSLGLIKLLISNGADLLAHDDYGITALHVAVRNEKAPEALYLSKMLENMEAIEIKDIFGSALYECVWWRHFDPNLAEVFMNRGIDVNKVIEWNFTALHAACFGGSIEAVQWLVANEANVDSLLGNSATPLCAAVESERDAKEKVQLLLEKGAKINYYEPEQPSALQIALENADLELIDLLLDNKADPNLRGGHRHTPLNYAILEEFGMEIITKMVKKGADVSQPGYHDQSPVHAAAMVDRIDVLEFLTKVGIDPLAEGPQGRSALAYAVAYCCFDAVNYILANKTINVSEVDGKGQTPLIIAVVQEDTEMVKLLLESGFDEPTILDTQDYRGKTALGYAVSGNNLEIVEELLGYGADPTVTDCRGCGLLYYALREGGVEMFDTIRGALEMHGPLNIEDWNDAVHAAVASFKWTTVEAFIKDEMTQLDYGGPDGWSPLYAAEIYGNIEAKMALGGAGAEFQQSSSDLEKPSRWHSKDRFPGLQLDSNGTTLRTIGDSKFLNVECIDSGTGSARADYPMLPLFNQTVYYFEIRITNATKYSVFSIGFCDDRARLTEQVGSSVGSWGFCSANGRLYENKKWAWGSPDDQTYGKGEVIGCGLNFKEKVAFYTRNGEVIGQAFQDIRGKLYPAVSMSLCSTGCEISAVFPNADGTSPDFMFQGNYETETLGKVGWDKAIKSPWFPFVVPCCSGREYIETE